MPSMYVRVDDDRFPDLRAIADQQDRTPHRLAERYIKQGINRDRKRLSQAINPAGPRLVSVPTDAPEGAA
jgi:predicted transcriptional regulator